LGAPRLDTVQIADYLYVLLRLARGIQLPVLTILLVLSAQGGLSNTGRGRWRGARGRLLRKAGGLGGGGRYDLLLGPSAAARRDLCCWPSRRTTCSCLSCVPPDADPRAAEPVAHVDHLGLGR